MHDSGLAAKVGLFESLVIQVRSIDDLSIVQLYAVPSILRLTEIKQNDSEGTNHLGKGNEK